MNQEEQTFIELVQWVANQKNVPLQVRKDFVAHLMAQGSMDEKSQAFVASLIERNRQAREQSESQLSALDAKLMTLGKAAHSQDQGLKAKVITEAENLINGLEQHFTSSFKARENEVAAQAESSQGKTEANQVAALKAQVGA